MKNNKSKSSRLRPIGYLIYVSKAGRFYHDGDGAGFIWRWWHPLAWLCMPLLFITLCVVCGVPEAWRERHEIGLRMKPYFVKHPDRLEWMP